MFGLPSGGQGMFGSLRPAPQSVTGRYAGGPFGGGGGGGFSPMAGRMPQQNAGAAGLLGQARQVMPARSMQTMQRPAQPMQQALPMQQAQPSMGSALGSAAQRFALSDSRSKQKIQDLEALTQRYEDLLDEPAARPQYPATGGDRERSALDDAFRRPGSYSYEYKDPSMAGAAPGRHVGPMADELRGIPGAVSRGEDGFDRVDVPRMALATTSQVAKQRRELDELHQRIADLSDGGDADAVLRTAAGRR